MKKKKTSYVFVVGGVMSGVGKGITAASISLLLKSAGLVVTTVKADPYLNVDAGTMNPTEHGEVFVMDSGLETDQDMGNYERFLNTDLPAINYMTNGMVFLHVIQKERALEYGGKCVEPTYHITQEIIRRIDQSAAESGADVVVIEIGGTIGEYQNAIFLEVIRMLSITRPGTVQTVMVSYLPIPHTIGEMKTKPTQNAVRQLNSYGVQPQFLVARSSIPIDVKRKEKLAVMCGFSARHIVSAPDVKSIYDIPGNFQKDGFGAALLESLGYSHLRVQLRKWNTFAKRYHDAQRVSRIAVVGKYFATGDFSLSDAYVSILESLKIAGTYNDVRVEIVWRDSSDFEDPQRLKELAEYDGVLIPGGFGSRGVEGKIAVARYCREHKIPTLGICYGLQIMVVEFARSRMKLPRAHTTEVDPKTPDPIVLILPEQQKKLDAKDYGGSMRLGSYPASIKRGTVAYSLYKKSLITERHRHRYEVNPDYHEQLKDAGLVLSGTSSDGSLVEIIELPTAVHPFYLGVQFHPEFLCRPLDPHPLFVGFVAATLGKSKRKSL
jgi:CTP synthase